MPLNSILRSAIIYLPIPITPHTYPQEYLHAKPKRGKMPPARTPIWDNFLTIPNDIDLEHMGIHFKARKNASYNNAWCIGCVDNYLNRQEYSQWQPLVWCDERTLALWRKYRGEFMDMVSLLS